MADLSPEQQQQIITALNKAGAKLPCPRCGNQSFSLVNGYFNQSLQTELGGIVIGGPSVPCIAVVCTRCGYLAQHALGTLGLLPAQPNNQQQTG